MKNLYINKEKFGKIFQRTMEDQYIQMWHQRANNSEILNTLNILKGNKYERSIYLNAITNIQQRTIMTKLRIDQHKLLDCVGRKKNTSILCPLCGENNETLSHFLFTYYYKYYVSASLWPHDHSIDPTQLSAVNRTNENRVFQQVGHF